MQTDAPASSSKEASRSFKSGRISFALLCWLASAATVATLAWIIFEIGRQALPAVQKFGLEFLTNSRWVPNRSVFGVAPFLIGTAVSSLIALIFALPLGLAIAIFLSEDFLPLPVRQFVRFTVEMLAAIPSVVYGLWGIFVVIPLVQAFGAWAVVAFKNLPVLNTIFAPPAYGNSMLTASLVLALMILPTITAISRSALVAVPGTLREGAYALGSTRWEAIFGVILPTAAPGIVAATILASGTSDGRDDGRRHAHRQQFAADLVASLARRNVGRACSPTSSAKQRDFK